MTDSHFLLDVCTLTEICMLMMIYTNFNQMQLP